MKFKIPVILMLTASLVAAGCGGGDGDKSKSDKTKDPVAAAQGLKGESGKRVESAAAAYKKKPKSIEACRELGASWFVHAAPTTKGKGKDLKVVTPKDRDESLARGIEALRQCEKIDKDDRATQQMLASALLTTGEFEEAKDILKGLAEEDRKDANAWYSYGVAAQNAGELEEAADAWAQFLKVAPRNDPRRPQIAKAVPAFRAQAKAQERAAAQNEEKDAAEKDAESK